MELKIGICDDDAAQVTMTENLTAQWARENGHNAGIKKHIKKCGEPAFFDFEGESDFDILLLDIEMGDMNGVTLAKKYTEEKARPCR